MKKPRPPADPDSANAAYVLALRWLTGRELSEGQVRERLARRGYSPAAVAGAVRRLIDERTLDDRRAATAIARTETTVKRRGPRRVLARLLAMRIDRDLAEDVVRELFDDESDPALMERALEKRLRGNPARLDDPLERRKALAYLVRQGFSPSAASGLIRKRRKIMPS